MLVLLSHAEYIALWMIVRTCVHMSPYGTLVHELKTASRGASIVIQTYGAIADIVLAHSPCERHSYMCKRSHIVLYTFC